MEILRGLLPFLLFAACPLAMLVMMRGMHGGHREHQGNATSNTEPAHGTATRLAAMEQEITSLRAQLDDARTGETVGQARNGGRG